MKNSLVRFLIVLLALAAAVEAQNAPKPNLSGTWVFNPQKSALKVPPPSSIMLTIVQNDPQVQLARTQVYGDQSFKWDLDIVADGQKEVVQNSPAYTANVRAYWQGNALIVDQKITAPDGTKATDQISYSLSGDGRMLEAVEHEVTVGAKGGTTNKWVYEKQGQ
jgi:hypothetical protein